jgi:hypothetical protein
MFLNRMQAAYQPLAFVALTALTCASPTWADSPAPPPPLVELEEDVYAYEDAQNGAGPMWCSGSTCLVRSGEQVFATGLELVKSAKPLNNCRWVLYTRATNGWQRVRASVVGLTREPSPLAGGTDGQLWLSAHPTLEPNATAGRSRPEILAFQASDITAARDSLLPEWSGKPTFTEHSYRSLAADGPRNEILLLIHSTNQWAMHWSFLDNNGHWSARGEVLWPYGTTYDRSQPVRIAYPNVLMRNREVHVCGVSDIVEPNPAWKAFKKELTGKDWDYDFRRLYYRRDKATASTTSRSDRTWSGPGAPSPSRRRAFPRRSPPRHGFR